MLNFSNLTVINKNLIVAKPNHRISKPVNAVGSGGGYGINCDVDAVELQ